MIHNALGDPVFLAQKTSRLLRPGPLLFVAELDHLFAHRTDVLVLKDAPVFGDRIGDSDRFFLVRGGGPEPWNDFAFAFERFVVGHQSPFDVVRDLCLGGGNIS